ncbi:hypothetical protein LguiB_020445 [Lonicera macranthoides]
MESSTICSFAFCFFEFAEAVLVIFCMVDLDCFHLFFYARYATLGLKSVWSLLLAIVDAAVLIGGIAKFGVDSVGCLDLVRHGVPEPRVLWVNDDRNDDRCSITCGACQFSGYQVVCSGYRTVFGADSHFVVVWPHLNQNPGSTTAHIPTHPVLRSQLHDPTFSVTSSSQFSTSSLVPPWFRLSLSHVSIVFIVLL